jgi:hypothetical protein
MMVQMLGVFAEFERATMVDRVIAGMERKAARGGWLGGPNPFGYRYNPATAMLEPDEAEAEIVRTIFDLYVTKRLGTKAVANWLNAHGYRTRAGRLWSLVTAFDVLRSPCTSANWVPRRVIPGASCRCGRRGYFRGGATHSRGPRRDRMETPQQHE